MKQTTEVLGDMQDNDIADIDEFESFNIQKSAPFGGKFNVWVKLSLV